MRILVVTSIFPRTEGDPDGSFVLDQTRALIARGHEVEVVVLERAGGPQSSPLQGVDHVRWVRYVPVPLRLGVWAWSSSIRSQLRWLRFTFGRGFDAAVVHDELVAVAVQPALEHLNIPWILVVHGENRNPALARRSGIRAKNDVYGRADAVVAVGEGVDLPLWAAPKWNHIPNGAGVPKGIGDPPERLASVMGISVSGLRPGKGIEDNLASLSRLVAEGIDVGYWVVGDGPLRAELERLTKHLGLTDRVRYFGSVSRDRLGVFLGAADFFALPSSPEAFGIAYLEAKQAGMPIVACRGEGPEGFTTDGIDGLLVTSGDAGELDAAWRELSLDAELRLRMGRNARRTAAPFTWAANAERFETLIGCVVERHVPRPLGRGLWWLGVEATAYTLDGVEAVRALIPDLQVAFLDGGGGASVWQLLAALLRRRAKVLFLDGWGQPSMLAAMMLSHVVGIPYIVQSDSHRPAGGRRGPIRSVVRALAIRPLVRRAAVLFPFGTPQTRYLRELVGGAAPPVVVAHMTVDTKAFERVAKETSAEERAHVRRTWGCSESDVVLLFVGRLVPDKGLAVLIEALDQLRNHPLRLVVFGAGPLNDRLRTAAARLPIHLAGAVSKGSLMTAYACADIFVLPSSFEPWGLVVNEAMAAGLPCVVSDAVGSREDLIDPGKNGWVFPAGDPRSLAKELQTLAADAPLRDRAGAAARERMRSWSIHAYAASVERAATLAKGGRR